MDRDYRDKYRIAKISEKSSTLAMRFMSLALLGSSLPWQQRMSWFDIAF
jgi:hypothetical protein